MPDRVIRDEILTSERYWSVSIEAQRLFVHLLLVVDDNARYSAKNYTIRAACFPGQQVDPARIEKLLLELVDVDLVRLYLHDGERFLFVPRFRQRLRYKNSRFPAPPCAINDLFSKKTDLSLTADGLKSAEVKRREEIHLRASCDAQAREASKDHDSNPAERALPGQDAAFDEFWRAYPRRKSRGQAERAWAKLRPSEQLVRRIISAVERAKTSADWRKDGGRFIPYPATWLNAKGWEDDLGEQPRERQVAI